MPSSYQAPSDDSSNRPLTDPLQRRAVLVTTVQLVCLLALYATLLTFMVSWLPDGSGRTFSRIILTLVFAVVVLLGPIRTHFDSRRR